MDGGWGPAPLSAAVPGQSPEEWTISVPTYEDFVLLRRRLPTAPRRALEAARRAAVADPEIRRRILRSEAARLAVHEAVELAVVQRMAEGRALRRWRT